MRNLTALLERFSRILNKDTFIKESIARVIENKTRATLLPESFSLKDGVLEIVTSPVIKNEISLKEDLIKSELKEVHHISISRILYK